MIETDKSSFDAGAYAYAIKIKHRYFDAYLTVGHIPREIYRHCFYYNKEGGVITGHVVSTNFKISPIPAGGLEIPPLLAFSAEQLKIHDMMKDFVGNLYDYNYCDQKVSNDQIDDDSDNEVAVSVE